MADDNKPAPEAIKTQLERILQCAEFRGSEKQRNFLRFVVDETLEGREAEIKGYTVAVSVYGRSEKFDPQIDPIVRVEAGRLRRALEHYYLTVGKNDPVHIKIPKGRYVPTYQAIEKSPPETGGRISDRDNSQLSSGPSIAVMPLLNLTGDEDQDYFADGLTEELTAELARYQEFQVIASQSTMRFKGRKIDPKEAGRALGVRFLLTGSIQKDPKTVKVAIRLIDTSTAEQIWGDNDKRDLSAAALITLQEEIAHRIVGVIADQYGLISRRLSRESRKKPPSDLKAYDAILRFYQYETELTPETFKNALEALKQAVEIDPQYGLAWAMLGHLYADNYALEFRKIEAPLDKALTFAQKGVALEPENQFAQDALTLVYFHQGNEALFLEHVEQTIDLNPNSPYIVGVAGWHMTLYGLWDRGLALLKKGVALNPCHPSWFHLAPYMYYYHRKEYINAFTEALKFNYPGLFWDPLMRAAALGRMGRASEAKATVGELLKLVPDFASSGLRLIGRFVKVDDLVDKIIEGLQKAGLAELK
ncbi:hypothetical protein ACFL9U_05535 [Thermodesulfobacteriota bacterium]